MYAWHEWFVNDRWMKFKETGDSKCNHQNELDKTSFQHDIVYKDDIVYNHGSTIKWLSI